MSTHDASRKASDELEQVIPPITEADGEAETTLPTVAATNASASEPALPDYFIAGVVATGFSAACVAVGTSFFGLQGTFIGGVAGAMAGSIASQVSKRRLLRIEHRTRVLLRRLTDVRGDDVSRWAAASPATLASLKTRIPWRAVASASLIAIVGFGIGAVGLSAVELVGGRPVSSVTSGEPTTGTTFQRIIETAVPAEMPAEGREAIRQSTPAASPTATEPVEVVSPAATSSASTPAAEAAAPDVIESPQPIAPGVPSPQASPQAAEASPSATLTVTATPSPRVTESAATSMAAPSRTATQGSAPSPSPSARP
jgi:hypothetical protein